MPSLSAGLSPTVRKWADAVPPFVVMVLWGLHLGFPLQLLQHIRGTFFGYVIPVYYFLIVFPMLGAAALTLFFKRHWTKWELLWWLLPLICVPGILLSDDRMWSIRQWLSWIVRGVIPGGVLFSAAREKSFLRLTNWIYPVIIAASLVGLGEVYDGGSINLWDNPLLRIRLDVPQPNSNPFYRPQDSSYTLPLSNRPGGTQGNRLAYASTLLCFLPLGLWLLKYKKRFYPARLAAVGILTSILLIAQVRAVWLGVLVSAILMWAVGLRRDRWETVRIIAGALVCLGVFLVWPRMLHELWSRFNSFHLTDPSIQARLQFLETATVLRDHWLFGVGFGQFPTACKPYAPQGVIWQATPDNQFLRWGIENGLVSLFLLLAFLFGLVRAGWKKIKLMKDVRQADFYKSLLIGWLGVALTFLFFDGFYWGACNMTFWCSLGLLATCLGRADVEQTS